MITYLARLKNDKEDMSKLRRFFTKTDLNHDGFLELHEIEKGLKEFSEKTKRWLGESMNWKKIIAKCDTD